MANIHDEGSEIVELKALTFTPVSDALIGAIKSRKNKNLKYCIKHICIYNNLIVSDWAIFATSNHLIFVLSLLIIN